MHYPTIPAPVTVDNMEGTDGKPPSLSFADFVQYTLATSKLWRATGTTIDHLTEVIGKVRVAKPGDVIALEDDEWELLQRVAQTHEYDPRVTVFLMPLLRAIVAAPKAKPEPKSPPPAEGAAS